MVVVKDFQNKNAKRIAQSKDTFTLRSFSDQQRVYAIDKISGGLILYSA